MMLRCDHRSGNTPCCSPLPHGREKQSDSDLIIYLAR